MRGGAALVTLLVATLSGACAQEVAVVRMQLSFGQMYTFTVNSSVEYILDYVPSGDEGRYPSRVWLSAGGAFENQPILVTARQRDGAVTWQLPYRLGSRLLHALERTLCTSAAADVPAETPGCGESETAAGAFTLHVGASCAVSVELAVRAQPALDWRLHYQAATQVTLSQESPRAYLYQFEEEQENVRLVVSSEDEVCASISVQPYSCPIRQTMSEVETSSLRMTMEQSGATQLSRSRFPQGFVVVALVRDSDEACRDQEVADEDWLWEAAIWGERDHNDPTFSRVKNLNVKIEPALTVTQYVVASAVTVAVFTTFYLAFFALLLARRWQPFGKLVEPKAVLAASTDQNGASGARTELDGADVTTTVSTTRRRRGSDATFDSSDVSDSDEEERTEGTAVTGASPTFGSSPQSPRTTDASGRYDSSPQSPRTTDTLDSSPQSPRTTDTLDSSPQSPRTTDTLDSSPQSPHTTDATDRPHVVLDPRTLQPPHNGTTRDGEGGAVSEGSTPFGLPARLRLAVLARRRDRVLRARSDRYLHTLLTVAVFYALPVVQFVTAFQIIMNVWGSLDLCYYNFLCAHPVGGLSDFNHVFSNLGYLLLGALFVLQVHMRRARRDRAPRHEEYGIPPHYGMLMSLGVCMMMVAVLSSTYHICPNRLNFQFDTAFMYVLAVLSMVKIYQSRHPDVNARAHVTFGVLAVLIALVVWGVLGGGALFWSVFTVLHLFTFLLLSLRIYYLGQFRFEKGRLATAAREWRARGAQTLRPLYTARLLMLLIANAVNWAFALYGLLTQQADFATHLLQVLLGNTLLYMVFYLVMKLVHGERPRWYAWCCLAGAAAAWAPALYFFLSGSTDWSATPAHSRHNNHECKLLHFYDNHDLWHLLSAVALYLSFNAMLTWDDGLAAVKMTEIPVF